MKAIHLSGHARLGIGQRRATELAVAETIREGSWMEAEPGRKECQKDLIFGQEWNRQLYDYQAGSAHPCGESAGDPGSQSLRVPLLKQEIRL